MQLSRDRDSPAGRTWVRRTTRRYLRHKTKLICAIAFWLVAANCAVAAARHEDGCVLPPDLRGEVSQKYPARRVVTLTDLSEYDRQQFQKDHGARCPGLVRVDFYGDGKPTWAVVLMTRDGSKSNLELIVARRAADGWEIRSLEETDGTAVVWTEKPR